jgi:hypothetical protein
MRAFGSRVARFRFSVRLIDLNPCRRQARSVQERHMSALGYRLQATSWRFSIEASASKED